MLWNAFDRASRWRIADDTSRFIGQTRRDPLKPVDFPRNPIFDRLEPDAGRRYASDLRWRP